MTKAAERARIRARRVRRDDDERNAAAQLVADAVLRLLPSRPGVVSAYRSLPNEPGTSQLISGVLASGHRLLLPRISGRDLQWVEVTAQTVFATGPLGIFEPTGEALPDQPPPLQGADVLVIPGLSVDRSGRRLGQGGGYYDRSLSQVPSHADGGPLRVCVLFDDEFVDEVPSEPHDCSVDVLVTPQRVVRFG